MRVGAYLNERQLTLQEHAFAFAVVNDHVRLGFGYNLVIFCLVVPDVKVCHFNGIFSQPRFHAVEAGQIQIDVTIHGWVDLRHDDAVDTFRHHLRLVHCRGHAGQNVLTLWVRVQASQKIRPCDEVGHAEGLLPVGIRNVLAQNSHIAWVHKVRVDRVLVNQQFHKRRIVNEAPSQGHREHLVGV